MAKIRERKNSPVTVGACCSAGGGSGVGRLPPPAAVAARQPAELVGERRLAHGPPPASLLLLAERVASPHCSGSQQDEAQYPAPLAADMSTSHVYFKDLKLLAHDEDSGAQGGRGSWHAAAAAGYGLDGGRAAGLESSGHPGLAAGGPI